MLFLLWAFFPSFIFIFDFYALLFLHGLSERIEIPFDLEFFLKLLSRSVDGELRQIYLTTIVEANFDGNLSYDCWD